MMINEFTEKIRRQKIFLFGTGFVAEMFKPDSDGKIPIDKYMEQKEANDPIKKFFAVARYSTI